MKIRILLLVVFLLTLSLTSCDPPTATLVENIIANEATVMQSADGLNYYIYATYAARHWYISIMTDPLSYDFGQTTMRGVYDTALDLLDDGYQTISWWALSYNIRTVIVTAIMETAPIWEVELVPLLLPYYPNGLPWEQVPTEV